MIPNILNTVLGIAMAYWAIFHGVEEQYAVPAVAAILIAILAVWARRSDFARWQSNVAIGLAATLLIFTGLRWLEWISGLGTFWAVFWVGVGVAIVALWAAIYRRPSAPGASAQG